MSSGRKRAHPRPLAPTFVCRPDPLLTRSLFLGIPRDSRWEKENRESQRRGLESLGSRPRLSFRPQGTFSVGCREVEIWKLEELGFQHTHIHGCRYFYCHYCCRVISKPHLSSQVKRESGDGGPERAAQPSAPATSPSPLCFLPLPAVRTGKCLDL